MLRVHAAHCLRGWATTSCNVPDHHCEWCTGELPKGSVSLATSASGSTFYMEPAPALELNNREAMLAAAEEQQEQLILVHLSRQVRLPTQSETQLLPWRRRLLPCTSHAASHSGAFWAGTALFT